MFVLDHGAGVQGFIKGLRRELRGPKPHRLELRPFGRVGPSPLATMRVLLNRGWGCPAGSVARARRLRCDRGTGRASQRTCRRAWSSSPARPGTSSSGSGTWSARTLRTTLRTGWRSPLGKQHRPHPSKSRGPPAMHSRSTLATHVIRGGGSDSSGPMPSMTSVSSPTSVRAGWVRSGRPSRSRSSAGLP